MTVRLSEESLARHRKAKWLAFRGMWKNSKVVLEMNDLCDRDEDEASVVCGIRSRIEAGRTPLLDSLEWSDLLPPSSDDGAMPSYYFSAATRRKISASKYSAAASEAQREHEEAARARQLERERIAAAQWAEPSRPPSLPPAAEPAASGKSGGRLFVVNRPEDIDHGQTFEATACLPASLCPDVACHFPNAAFLVRFANKHGYLRWLPYSNAKWIEE